MFTAFMNQKNGEPEFHTSLGFLQPIVTGGISKRADNTLSLTLGLDIAWDLVTPGIIMKCYAFTVGLDDSVDFRKRLKMQLEVYYFAGFSGGDLTTNRIAASAALSLKLKHRAVMVQNK